MIHGDRDVTNLAVAQYSMSVFYFNTDLSTHFLKCNYRNVGRNACTSNVYGDFCGRVSFQTAARKRNKKSHVMNKTIGTAGKTRRVSLATSSQLKCNRSITWTSRGVLRTRTNPGALAGAIERGTAALDGKIRRISRGNRWKTGSEETTLLFIVLFVIRLSRKTEAKVTRKATASGVGTGLFRQVAGAPVRDVSRSDTRADA